VVVVTELFVVLTVLICCEPPVKDLEVTVEVVAALLVLFADERGAEERAVPVVLPLLLVDEKGDEEIVVK
jgi:hypothetical protein